MTTTTADMEEGDRPPGGRAHDHHHKGVGFVVDAVDGTSAASLGREGSVLESLGLNPDIRGAAPTRDFLSVFNTVSSVALTLMGTSLPLHVTSKASVAMLQDALLFYVLAAITVTLFFLQMHEILELTCVLLWHEQALLLLWVMHIILLPICLQHVIALGRLEGSIAHWTDGQAANIFCLASYVLLSGLALLLILSLCTESRHRALAQNRAARRRKQRAALGGFLTFLLLILAELFSSSFNAEFLYVVPIVLLVQRVYEAHAAHQEAAEAEQIGMAEEGMGMAMAMEEGRRAQHAHAHGTAAAATTAGTHRPGVAAAEEEALEDEEDEEEAMPRPIPRLKRHRPSSYTPASFVTLMRASFSNGASGSRSRPYMVQRRHTFVDLFNSVTGTALTILGVSFPLMAQDKRSLKQPGEFGKALFMFYLGAGAVALYWVKMRRLLTFRRSMLLREEALLCVYLYAIILVPTLVGIVIEDGGGRGSVREWTTAQILNTMLIVTQLVVEGVLLAYTYSLHRWARRAAASLEEREQEGEEGGGGQGLRAVSKRKEGKVDLRGLVRKEAVQVGVTAVLFLLELFTEWMNREYLFLIPIKLLLGEAYTILFLHG